jgi:hypothetical protein
MPTDFNLTDLGLIECSFILHSGLVMKSQISMAISGGLSTTIEEGVWAAGDCWSAQLQKNLGQR